MNALRAAVWTLTALLGPAHAAQVPERELPSAPELFSLAGQAFAPDASVPPPRTLIVRGKARLSDGSMSGSGTWTELHRLGVGTRITFAVEGLGTFEQGAAQGVVWERHPTDGVRLLDGFDADAALRRFAWYRGSGWRDGYRELRAPRRASREGCASLSLVAPFRRCEHALDFEGREVLDTLTLDLASGLPVELVLADHTRAGRPVERLLELDGWRGEGGRRWPTRRRERFGALTIDLTIETLELDPDPPLADDAFAPPAEVTTDTARPPADPDEIRVRTIAERPVAVIRLRCAPADVGRELALAGPELARAVQALGAHATGPTFVRRLVEGPDELELELGLPLAEPLDGPLEKGSRVVPATLPAGDVATAWHTGSHGTLGATRERLARWMVERDLVLRAPAWEVWWSDPGSEPDQALWRTEILCPIERAR
jgi:hypothetical protein